MQGKESDHSHSGPPQGRSDKRDQGTGGGLEPHKVSTGQGC